MQNTETKSKTLIVNFFGGPGAGKSTQSAKLFAALKEKGVNCELVREYAKDLVWEERRVEFLDQLSVMGKQTKRLNSLVGKVEIIVTDSPLLLSITYNKTHNKEIFDKIVLETFNFYNNFNVIIKRKGVYNPKGRFQTEEEAKQLDVEIEQDLKNYEIDFIRYNPEEESVDNLTKRVIEVAKKL